jgi:lysine 2,3-aminomutase
MPKTAVRSPFASSEEVCRALVVTEGELAKVRQSFPVRWPREYLQLAAQTPAIALMGRPDERELVPSGDDLADPVADMALRPVPFLVRKHPDRAIVLVSKSCHFYCRFCFRRDQPHEKSSQPQAADWRRILDYLAANPDIGELILSGGDPLTLDDATLAALLGDLQSLPQSPRLRIHTRAPVHYPERVDRGLCAILGSVLASERRLVLHFNHPAEFRPASFQAIERLRDCGWGLLNQSVLLAGVNDQPDIQIEILERLNSWKIQPYYLHHPDRASGNHHFRLTISAGRALWSAVQNLSHHPLPRYVIDLPDGSGKVDVLALEALGNGQYHFRHGDGRFSLLQDLSP